MKLNAITALAMAGAQIAQSSPINATSSSGIPVMDSGRFCRGFMAETGLQSGWHKRKIWLLSKDTKECELAAHKSCAMLAWNPLEELINVGAEDLVHVLSTFVGSFSRRGYAKGNGALFCDEDVKGNKKDLPFKLDYPKEKDLAGLGDLKI
ncbi:hypothetical protein B0T14DRAFT_561761 [Immersiella caudata]|uniref:Uncharacterized protein n=1 Tax=Immersiella caudata TaxID=314043 RepID=A0AA39X1Y2_9PEZI|nr:hypothetical protein B0T14DRAFT_561761 [Immersiella caudata]